MYMDSIERLARALAEWDLNLEDERAAGDRFGESVDDRTASVERNWRKYEDQAAFLLGSLVQPHGTADSALDHLRRFRALFNSGEPVDEESGLTADDLTKIIHAVEAFGDDVVSDDPEGS